MSPKLLNALISVSSFAIYYILIGPLWTGNGSIWSPSGGGIKNLVSSEAQYKETLGKADELFKQGEELRSQYNSIDDDTKQKMLLMVPSKIDKIILFNELDVIASKTGVALNSVFINETPSSDKLKGQYTVSFKAKTTYSRFKEFMRNYENSLRLFTLDSVLFTAPEKKDDLIEFTVNLKTYYIK